MEHPLRFLAGKQTSFDKKYLIHLKQEVTEYAPPRAKLESKWICRPAGKENHKKRYLANRRQEKLDKQNQRMIAYGVTPRNTNFRHRNNFYGTPLIVPFHQRILWKFKVFFLKI